MTDSIISEEICKKVLQNYLQENEVKYVDFNLVPLSETIEGFLGEHYRLQIKYKKYNQIQAVNLFVKTKPFKNQTQKDIVQRTPVYIKEIFVYDYLLKEFEKYGYNTNFAPKSYFCIADKTLIIDDLISKGYKLQPRHNKFDLKQIECVLKSLALYHGAGFAYKKTKSEEIGKEYHFNDEYPTEFKEIFFIRREKPEENLFWNGNYKLMDRLIDELPDKEEFKREFKSLLKQFDICKIFTENTNLIKTCCHGDLWSNNMMFKYENETATHCCLLDFQLIRYFYPALDVILAIFFNTSMEFRKTHLNYLYQFYYECLSSILKRYGLSILNFLSKEDFKQSLEFCEANALAQVTVINAFIYTPENILTESVKKNDDSLSKILHTKEIALKAFKNDDLFRKVITESLYDLYNALLKIT